MLKNGDRVVHSIFGLGQIVNCEKNIWVYFVGEGPKQFSKSSASQVLKLVTGDESESYRLDNICITFNKNNKPSYASLHNFIETFKKKYKLGFDDPKYLESERNYKLDAIKKANELLGKKVYKSLLDSNDEEEICKRILKSIRHKFNFLHRTENVNLGNAIKNDLDAQVKFSNIIYSYLYGEGSDEEKFDLLSNLLGEYKVDTWPTFTVMGFLFKPETHIMLKPETVKTAAELSGFNISYDSCLNFKTYTQTQKFYHWLRSELEKVELYPKDLIDIQSFMYEIKKIDL